MNPCSECGGSGICSRCADMPWLPCPNDGLQKPWMSTGEAWHCHEGDSLCGGRGRFKPDPDSIMAWCYTHDSRLTDGPTFRCERWYLGFAVDDACDPGWVARPQRLETVEVDDA